METRHIPFNLLDSICNKEKRKKKRKRRIVKIISPRAKLFFWWHWLHIGLIQWKFVKSQGCLNRSPSTDSLSPLSPDALSSDTALLSDNAFSKYATTWPGLAEARPCSARPRNNRQTFAAGFDERNLSNTKSISELTGWKKCKYKFHEEYSNIPPCFNIFPPISGLIFHRIILSDEI